MKDNLRQRGKRKLLRVRMPDGKVICHKSATMTFVEALAEIGPEHFSEIKVELGHLPLLSREIYPRFKDYMKPVAEGWYVNTQSDTDQKFLQLTSIKKQLGIELEAEVGTDFETSNTKVVQKTKSPSKKIMVTFPDGETVSYGSTTETYVKTVCKVGVDAVWHKGIEYAGKPLITTTKRFNGQVEVGKNRWLTIPPSTKDKYNTIVVLGDFLRIKLNISYVERNESPVLDDNKRKPFASIAESSMSNQNPDILENISEQTGLNVNNCNTNIPNRPIDNNGTNENGESTTDACTDNHNPGEQLTFGFWAEIETAEPVSPSRKRNKKKKKT